jgi:hypothetical protein
MQLPLLCLTLFLSLKSISFLLKLIHWGLAKWVSLLIYSNFLFKYLKLHLDFILLLKDNLWRDLNRNWRFAVTIFGAIVF